jgi:hypothetical protein
MWTQEQQNGVIILQSTPAMVEKSRQIIEVLEAEETTDTFRPLKASNAN